MISNKIELIKNRENRTTVYIWLDRDGSFGHAAMKTYIGGPYGLGHYISLWPKSDFKEHITNQARLSIASIPLGLIACTIGSNPLLNLLNPKIETSVEGYFQEDVLIDGTIYSGYMRDVIAMSDTETVTNEDGEQEIRITRKREPDLTFEFYNFSGNNVNKAFEYFREYPPRWTLISTSTDFRAQTHNCCSFIVSILKAIRGGNPDFKEVFSPQNLEEKLIRTLEGQGKLVSPRGLANFCEKLRVLEHQIYEHVETDAGLPICAAYENYLQHEDNADEYRALPSRKPAPKIRPNECKLC